VLLERSAGAVIFRFDQNHQPLYLLLQKTDGKWDFPKGNIERGEKTEETVRREIAEETGVTTLDFLPNFKESIHIFYRRDKQLVSKWIAFFLTKTVEEKVKISWEHQDFAWLSYVEAESTLSYAQSKKVLRKVTNYLRLKGNV